ncbi:hypothetical protein ACRQ5Q_14725 [Bradyrhizobium sp. PMVTL-01]|uniref:hypothetical protein n=1 Tax=Bradyrhizobium sp. PMVTL-01 TaxID=3434999 RepID=UPI003F6E61CE
MNTRAYAVRDDDIVVSSAYPLPARSLARPEPGVSLWIDRTVKVSPIEAIALAVGHVALGVIIGLALIAYGW